MTFPRDPNAPKSVKFRRLLGKEQYHIKADPLGQASFPKPIPELPCNCGWQDCTNCGASW